MKQSRSLLILVAISFLIHAMLLVNSAESTFYNSEKAVGNLLAQQLANNAAPLLLNQDSVGLGLVADKFGQTPSVLSLRILKNDHSVVAAGGTAPSQRGYSFNAPISSQGQPLGTVEVVLASPARGDIVRINGLNLLLSLFIHGLIGVLIQWPHLLERIRIPILQPLPPIAKPEPVVEPEPEPVKPAASVFLQVALDDSKGLLQRVNATTAEQMLLILEKLLKRSVRLYEGQITHHFGPEGAVIRFDGDNAQACMERALACGKLYLSLADTAYQQRRTAKLFALPSKAATYELLAEQEDSAALTALQQLVKEAKIWELLVDASATLLTSIREQHTVVSLKAPEPTPETDTEKSADEEPASELDLLFNPDLNKEPEPPYRVLTLAESVQTTIEQQKQQILERRKAQASA